MSIEELYKRLQNVEGTKLVELAPTDKELYKFPENHAILLVHNEPRIKDRLAWKKEVLKALRECGWQLEDPLEDTGEYLYMVVEKTPRKLTEAVADDLKKVFDKVMSDNYYKKDKDGTYHIEIYLDRNDKLSDEAIRDICQAEDPLEYFYEVVENSYRDSDDYYYIDLKKNFVEEAKKSNISEEDAEDWFAYNFYDYTTFDLPYKELLGQEVKSILVVDSGDSNYDFSLNPAYHNEWGKDELDDKASIVWLVKQQGHTKEELEKALEEEHSDDKFINSVVEECINNAGSMSAVCFLGRVTLEDLIANDIDKVTVKPSVMCGLIDLWSGSGSSLGIELGKDVVVPKDKIWYFGVDADDSSKGTYSADSIYGLSGGAYKPYVFTVSGKKLECVHEKKKSPLDESIENINKGLDYLNSQEMKNKIYKADLNESVSEIKQALSELFNKYFKKK